MAVVALAAVNLAFLRAVPAEIAVYPTVWVFWGAAAFVVLWKLVLKRPLHAFHYTFLIVFVSTFIVVANLVATGRLHLQKPVIRAYQLLAGANRIGVASGFLDITEFWLTCLLSGALAFAIGMAAARLESRRNWDIAAFSRGALVGFAVFGLLAVIHDSLVGAGQPSPTQVTGRMVILGVCMIIGGRMGLSRLKSCPSSGRTPAAR